MTKKLTKSLVGLAVAVIGALGSYQYTNQNKGDNNTQNVQSNIAQTPTYTRLANMTFENGGKPYYVVNQNQATLKTSDWQSEKIDYGDLDRLNRTTTDTAYLSKRNLGHASNRARQNWQPTGWHNQPVYVNGKRQTPQNRGHLIAYAMTFNFDKKGQYQQGAPGSLDNPKNLASQSEFSNQNTMQIFEERVRYALQANKKVIYQVTTVFKDNELMPRGYWLQAISTDKRLNFNVYVWNVAPGISYDYKTGRSKADASIKVINEYQGNRYTN